MLSEDLQNLVAHLESYEQSGESLPPEHICGLNGALKAAVINARALEQQLVPQGARLCASLPENVIALLSRTKEGCKPWHPANQSGPEGAV